MTWPPKSCSLPSRSCRRTQGSSRPRRNLGALDLEIRSRSCFLTSDTRHQWPPSEARNLHAPGSADSHPGTVDSHPATADSLPGTADSLPGTADSLPETAYSLPETADSLRSGHSEAVFVVAFPMPPSMATDRLVVALLMPPLMATGWLAVALPRPPSMATDWLVVALLRPPLRAIDRLVVVLLMPPLKATDRLVVALLMPPLKATDRRTRTTPAASLLTAVVGPPEARWSSWRATRPATGRSRSRSSSLCRSSRWALRRPGTPHRQPPSLSSNSIANLDFGRIC